MSMWMKSTEEKRKKKRVIGILSILASYTNVRHEQVRIENNANELFS